MQTNSKLIAQGAEAIIYSDGSTVVKDRFTKKYRHPEIDTRLRRSRTRREGKILTKLVEAEVHVPDLIKIDDKEMKISMSHIPGDMIKVVVDCLEKKADYPSIISLMKEIGECVAVLHNKRIVHQDLTTSNMILHADKKKVYLIEVNWLDLRICGVFLIFLGNSGEFSARLG